MKYGPFRNLLIISALTGASVLAAPGFLAPEPVTVGRNLEVFTSMRLAESAPEGGLQVTITSDDPSRLLLARNPEEAGSKSIVLKMNGQYRETPDFYVQALGDKGTVTYTATAPGFGSISGAVALAPSAILIAGPFKQPSFKTTPHMPAKITVFSGILDQSGKFITQQPISGGSPIQVKIASSDPAVGSVKESELTLNAGETSASTLFNAAGLGKTILTPTPPAGFTTPSELSAVTVNVELPGIGLTGEIFLGKDLEVSASILLGEPAPPGGVDVTLTSSNPKALILSKRVDEIGSGTITVNIPAGEMRAPYHLQALADSGTVEHTASAPGYRVRGAPIFLAPSGFMVVYGPYGPPDEAEYLRTVLVRDPRPFTVSLSDSSRPVQIALWSVYLDPKTLRGADITAQRLRPGVSATLDLKNSNPAVAKVASSVRITGPAPSASSDFVPLSPGQTVISINAPAGFAAPSNATSVTATVKE